MSKKIFVRNARVVQGKRWYIDYLAYDPDTGTETRQRKDFLLNEVENVKEREIIANHLIKVLDQLPIIIPEKKSTVQTVQAHISVRTAVEQALKQKATLRKETVDSYKSITKHFLEWTDHVQYSGMPVADFSVKHIKAYLEYCRNRFEYRNKTLNNKINGLQAIWTEIVEAEYVSANVWMKQKRSRVEAKLRRPFAEGDKQIVSAYIKDHDYFLYRAVLLLYFCYIRPAEMCRLRFKDFDLGNGLITITEFQAKTHKRRVVTIPKSILNYFVDGQFDKYPGSYFVFGELWKPNSKKQLDKDSLAKRHVKVLKLLHERGDLADITGYSMYSWKDSGVSAHAKKTSAISTKDQAGHSDMAMTLKYYHQDVINEEYRALENDLH